MSSTPLPIVRYLIVCDDVVKDPNRPKRVTIVGLISAIRVVSDPPFPLLYRELVVFSQLTEVRAAGEIRVDVVRLDDDQLLSRTRAQAVNVGNDPLAIHGLVFRIRDVVFPAPGLHAVRLWYNDQQIAEQPFLLR